MEHALALCRSLPHKSGELYSLILLADLSQSQGKYSESIASYEQALQLSRLLGDVTKEALILGSLEHTTFLLGDYAAAENQLTEALSIAIQIKDEFWQAWMKLRLGEMWHERGEIEKALSLIKETFQTAEDVAHPRFQAAVLYHWGNVLISQENWAQSVQKYQKAYDLWQETGQIENSTQALADLAYGTYKQKSLSSASAYADCLWQAWQDHPEWAERANLKLYWMLGMVWKGLGDSRVDNLWNKARTLLKQRSEKIEDDKARQMFLENVTAHRALLKST